MPTIRRLIATVAVLVAATMAPQLSQASHKRYKFPHHPECSTLRCARAADRAYARHHRPRFHMTPFEVCVANHESGAPEDAYNPRHIDWRYSDGTYEGAYNWLNSTWNHMKRSGFPDRAVDATPKQQVLVFRAHAFEPGQWPKTVPACS